MKHLLDREAQEEAVVEAFTGLCVAVMLLVALLWVYG